MFSTTIDRDSGEGDRIEGLFAIQFRNVSHCVPQMMENRPPPDTFTSEINIYKPFDKNDMESFPNRELNKAIIFYLVPNQPVYL